MSFACGTELLRLELKTVLQPCLLFSGIRLQPTMFRHSGSHPVPNNCFWRPVPCWGGGSHTRPSRADVYDALCRAEQMCWGLPPHPPPPPPPHPAPQLSLFLCPVDSEHFCLQALSCIHQGRRWWVGPPDAPRWHWAVVRKLEPADPTGSPGEGCSEGPAR